MKSLVKSKKSLLAQLILLSPIVVVLWACGGGGGGGSSPALYYPYENVYGDICSTLEATPGCTFLRSDDTRIKVTEDPHYNNDGNGSNDMWYVKFDSSGRFADSYNQDEVLQEEDIHISEFANYINGSTIGVGTSGFFWEDVSSGTYWLGKNGVLYNANSGEEQYGQAINSASAGQAADTNFAALSSEANDKLVQLGANKLQTQYGFKPAKARAIASALNRWGVAAQERGRTTAKDMDTTFKAVFGGISFSSALAAVKELKGGNKSPIRDLTSRAANALDIQPHEAQRFIKGMYKQALASWGYEGVSW